MDNFLDKVAVITGGASGIGLAVAEALAAEGARLVLADIEQAALDDAVASFEEAGVAVTGMRTDVSSREDIVALADHAFDVGGGVDIVFNNAGVAVFGAIQDMTQQDWAWTMNVNVWGPIHGIEVFVPRMIEQGRGGHVLFTASFAGLVANRELGAYNVSKAAVVAMAESLRKDVREHNIGVSVLCPMRVQSNIDLSARNRPDELGGSAANRTYTAEELEALDGRLIDTAPVAALVLDAMRRNDLYIHTHQEAATYFQRRADRISDAFKHAL
jgi:NAD(P)-dependent dehydrogenase (short-subunit alcohol dehydrogenase family)